MTRTQLSGDERARGDRLARILRDKRAVFGVSAENIAVRSGVSVETVRRIERGLVPSPGFFTVALLARALELGLDDLATAARLPDRSQRTS